MKYKNCISNFLAGRTAIQIAQEFGTTRQMIYYYINGRSKPHRAYMAKFLTILGKPWGRILDEKEVWE